MSEYDEKYGPLPMRVQVMPGSEAEYRHYHAAARHSDERIERKALAPGVTKSPQDDLVFRGGKTLPKLGFQNVYLGRSSDFASGDVESIDDAITRVILTSNFKMSSSSTFLARGWPMTSRRRSCWRKLGPTRWTSPMSRTKLSTCSTVTSSSPPTSIVRASTWCFHRKRS